MNGKLKVTSARTKGVIYIPYDQVVGFRKARNGEVIVDRECGVNLRVRETMAELTAQMERLEQQQMPVKAPVTRHTTIVRETQPVVLPQRGYRPADRGDAIINTVLGVGGGIILGDMVSDLFGFGD